MEKCVVFLDKEKTYKEIQNISKEYDTIILDLGDLDINPQFLVYLLKIFRFVKKQNKDLFFISKKGIKNEINKYFRVFATYEEYKNAKIYTSYTVKLYSDNTYIRSLIKNVFVANGFLTKERTENKFFNKEHDSWDKDIYILSFEKYQEEKLKEILKIKKKNPDSKVVLLIDKNMAHKALKTVQLGVDSIIEKPINIENLLQTVKKMAIQSQLRLENKMLNQKIKVLYKNLENELALANDIQKNLMPPENIEFNGYKIQYKFYPSQKIGGDFCEILKIDDDKMAIIFADISGHGIPAALLSMLLNAIIRSEFNKYIKISELMENLNEKIITSFPNGKFVSLFYIILDTKKNTITYCKGSQEPALMIDNNKVKELETEGQILGAFSKKTFPDLVNFEQKTCEFLKDTVILLYTDGITEAIKDGKYYGLERLKQNFLNTRQDIFKLKKTLNDYHMEDDLTLLTICRTSEK